MSSPEVRACVVLVNYNGADDTIECLKSLHENAPAWCRPVVVDNASPVPLDEAQSAAIRQTADLVFSPRNGGFSAGNNLGIRYALEHYDPQYLLLLNNDTVVRPGAVQQMVELADSMGQACGIVTCKTLYHADPSRMWYGGGTFDERTGFTTHEFYNEVDPGQTQDREVTFASGCVMLVPSAVVREVGYLEESYFLYSEDVEYCCRVRAAGKAISYCPRAEVLHKVSASTGCGSPAQEYYMTRNALYVASRFCASRPYALLRQLGRVAKDVLLRRRRLSVCRLAVRDFFKGVDGPCPQGYFDAAAS